ncbi:MAG: hypothetical protein GF388_00615 [Candidatus Aegiribacteria sp.]|nr:hypothetical protein [Candidatus Aegiribacteria sp.]MBD3293933.1 hypothetical protein [Candidatus Fermentibacteria bacterium]
MKRDNWKTMQVLAGVLLLMAAGCVQEPSEELSDQENIQNLLSGNQYVRMDPLDQQGESGSEKDGSIPEYWWREVTTEGTLEVVFENDPAVGVCTLTVTRELIADFNIDTTHDGQLNPGIKPIEDIRTRRLIVEKTDDDSAPHGGWTLTHITPAEFKLNSGLEQEVWIQSMELYQGDELMWSCTSTDSFYSVEDELPVLEPGELVRLEVQVLHTNPQYQPPFYVFAHGPCPTWPRHWMNDDGLWGDRVAGDNVYSYEWYVEATSEHWFVAADIIDADTMLDQTENDYDSGAWGILALKTQ